MFWIGMFLGFIIGFIALFAVSCWYCATHLCNSWDEFADSIVLIGEASDNRESELRLCKDGDVLDSVAFNNQ